MKKLSATAKVLYTITKVISVLFVVAACIIVAASVLLFAFGNDSMVEFTGLGFGNLEIQLKETEVSMELIRAVFMHEMLPALLLLVLGWVVVRMIGQILLPMKEGRPFDTAVSVTMKKLCWTTLIGGFIAQTAAIACTTKMFQVCDLSALLMNDKIAGVKLNMEMDMSFLVLALIWYMLSCVFRYGEELQKQSDETL